jgi:WD40 repeat protein
MTEQEWRAGAGPQTLPKSPYGRASAGKGGYGWASPRLSPLLLALACLVGLAGLRPPRTPAEEKGPGRADRQPRTDRFGDLLPRHAIARLGTERLRHGGSVTALAYSRDGKLLASASNDDNEVLVWEIPTGKRLHRFTVPGKESQFLLFCRDGTRLASLGDGVLQVWDVRSGKELLWALAGENGRCRHALAFSADGRKVAAVVAGRAVHIWDVATRREVRKWEVEGVVRALAFLPNDKLLAVTVGEKQVVLWDLPARKKRHTLPMQKEWIADLALSPDGQAVAFEVADKVIAVYDAVTGRERQRLAGHTGAVWLLTFTADGKGLLSGSWDSSLRLWDLTRGKERLRLATVAGGLPFGVLSPDTKTVATGGANSPHAVLLWDATTGRASGAFPGHTSPVASVALSPDGKLAATSSWLRGEAVIWLWEAGTGRPIRTFAGHKRGTCAVAFSPDGKRLASGG